MKHLYSISTKPGKVGEYYYNTLFGRLGMPHIYRALEVRKLTAEVVDVLRLNSAGFSVTMPYKADIIQYLDVVDPAVSEFESCNTVISKDNLLYGYNTDYYGVQWIVSQIKPEDPVSILGNGAIAKMFKKVIGDRATVYARSLDNWDDRYKETGVIINCTPIGMVSTPGTPLPDGVPECAIVVDLTIHLQSTLEKQCIMEGIRYIRGGDFYRRQFLKQFELYTGTTLAVADFDAIAK